MENTEEIKSNAAQALRKLNPKEPFGTELFEEIVRVATQTTFEAVILKKTSQGIEVFMTQRSVDEAYGGQWHCPGTFIRVGETEENVFSRLESKEKVGKFINKVFIDYNNTLMEERGHIIQLIFLCDIEPIADTVGVWFPVDDLPENMVENHRVILIPKATKVFHTANSIKVVG